MGTEFAKIPWAMKLHWALRVVFVGGVLCRLGELYLERNRLHEVCRALDSALGKQAGDLEVEGRFSVVPGGSFVKLEEAWVQNAGSISGRIRLGDVRFSNSYQAPIKATLGSEVRIRGKLVCDLPALNPAFVADGRRAFNWPRFRFKKVHQIRLLGVVRPAGFFTRVQNGFQKYVAERLSARPGLYGLAHGVWFGDSGKLPAGLVVAYREAGLLQILALSGGHVWSLVFLLSFVFRTLGTGLYLFFRHSFWWLQIYRAIRVYLALAASAVLFVLSDACPSMARTFLMLLFRQVLLSRGFKTDSLTLTTSTTGLILLWVPEWIVDPGFLLSALATYCLFLIWDFNFTGPFQKSFVEKAIWLSLLLPWVLLPTTTFLFGRMPMASSLFNALLNGVWSTFWIPVGFLAPLIAALPLGAKLLGGLEALWQVFCQHTQYVFPLSISVPRFNVWEWIWIQGGLLYLIKLKVAAVKP